eukprot:TRINITY_DN5383_c0_g1_i1.p4 TRINITY_DN5383_c0_g1~~TRINITY_DN5383_c0_g1_i1.p4  ORF type:complete len:160 (+),score=30.96 TRINITY_DN5383_c0_g1_i1:840-1319(+)
MIFFAIRFYELVVKQKVFSQWQKNQSNKVKSTQVPLNQDFEKEKGNKQLNGNAQKNDNQIINKELSFIPDNENPKQQINTHEKDAVEQQESDRLFLKTKVNNSQNKQLSENCLLYTSDAADEEDSVDLGGRRIIKKKTMKRSRKLSRLWLIVTQRTVTN